MSNRFASWLRSMIACGLLLGTISAAAAAGGVSKATPRLASMQIEIWPDYDRPAALVILKAEIAKDVPLPAPMSLRIPASSGGPAALAYAAAEKDGLMNLKYQRSDAKDFITLHFNVPERFVHLEFYDHFAKGGGKREYRYLWPGDLAVGWMSVVVQEPAGASHFSVQPRLEGGAPGADGLHYWSTDLGALERGKRIAVRVRYTKSDPRTSQEILGAKSGAPPAAVPTGAAAAPALPTSLPPEAGSHLPLLLTLGIGLPLLLAWSAYFWWRRRARPAIGAHAQGRSCRQCGKRVGAADRFCPGCGAPLA